MAMKISYSSLWLRRWVAIAVAALLWSPAMSHRAYASGSLWSSQTAPVNESREKIIFVDNPDSTVTEIVQVPNRDSAQKFAWVIPVPGKPMVGVSSNAVFQRLDAATAPQYWVEVTVEGTCKQHDSPDAASDAGYGPGDAPARDDATAAPLARRAWASAGHMTGHPSPAGVQVIDRGSIGPYEYVDIGVDPTLGDAARIATEWLTSNGYDLAGLHGEGLSRYLKDGLNLLALRLASDRDVSAIRPVILTYEGKLPMIPIPPTAAAAWGIQVWVIGPSQAVPDNYRSLVINDALLEWPTGRKYVAGTLPAGGVGPYDPYYVSKPGNYDAVVNAAAREAGGQGFLTELGAAVSQYRGKVWSSRDDHLFVTISSQKFADGIDALSTASAYYRGWDGWKDAVEGATTLPAGVTIDEFGRNPDAYRGVTKVDTTKFFQLLDEKVLRPVVDVATMLYRAPYLTRLYSVMDLDETTASPAFRYNSDLASVSDIHIARQSIQCSPTVEKDDAPWRIGLPQGGEIVGKGSGWPVAAGAMPASLKIVQVSTTGSGTVVKDNSDDIGLKLFEITGTTGSGTAIPHVPQHGVTIGGTQIVTQHGPTGSTPSTPSTAETPSSSRCSVSQAGAGTCCGLAAWLPQAAVILALRRRRRRRDRRHAWRVTVDREGAAER